MKRHGVFIVSVIALVLLVAFSALLATRHVAPEASSIPSPLLGRTAPTFSGSTIDGTSFSLPKERGKIVVVDFWSSWCAPCAQEAPELSSFAWEQRHRGVVVIGVLWNDEVAAARAFESQYGSLYSTVLDPGGQIANSFGVTAPPTIFVIDARGRVATTLIGATNDKQLTAVINRIRP